MNYSASGSWVSELNESVWFESFTLILKTGANHSLKRSETNEWFVDESDIDASQAYIGFYMVFWMKLVVLI